MRKKLKIILLVVVFLTIVNIYASGLIVNTEKINNDELNNEETKPIYNKYHADAGKTYSGFSNEKIIFDGSASYIGFKNTAIYEWDFGDDYNDTPGIGLNPVHIYSKPGVYYVTLTITDNSGNKYIDIAPVFIDKIGNYLKPYGGCVYFANINEEILFDASKSTSEKNEIIEWFWDFGDGKTAYGEKVRHSYDNERVYIVTLNIKDKNGLTRHDVLHADIGYSFSSLDDLFRNSDNQLKEALNLLLNKMNYSLDMYSKLLDLKIYTNYNGKESLTDLEGINPLPIEIDVNNNGVKDVKVNKMTFFEAIWAPSMFNEQSRIWLQFETKISSIQMLSNDILPEDDFTICLQIDFSIIADKLNLDDAITRIGYYSPAGEVKPDSITLVHILRPYLLFRLFGFVNSQDQGISTNIFCTNKTDKEYNGYNEKSNILNNYNLFQNTEIDKNYYNSNVLDEKIQNPSYLLNDRENSETYWPEYGLRIQSSGGGSFSLFTMFLNEAGSSKTSCWVTYGSSLSTLMYKRAKTGGLLNHATVFEIPGNTAEFKLIREKNNQITQMSSGFSFNVNLIRGISWRDEGINVGILGQTTVDITDLYFDNPICNFSLSKLSLALSGDFNLNISNEVKLSIDGNSGFVLSNLSYISKINDFNAKILGTLSMDVNSEVHVALSSGLLEIGFNGNLQLLNDCTFLVNDIAVIVTGDFSLDGNGIIVFSWDDDEFKIDLEDGVLLQINNLYFEVGELKTYADLIKIEASGLFVISWDIVNNEITIEGGSGVSLGLENIDIIYGDTLEINILGFLEVQADGYITFGPDVFKAGFSGSLNLGINGNYCEFLINDKSIKVGGLYTFTGGDGELIFSWNQYGLTISISGDPELSVNDLYFNIGNLVVNAEYISIGVSGQLTVEWNTAINEVTISSGSNSLLAITDLDINYASDIQISIIGSLEIQADGYLTFGPGVFKAGFDGTLDLGASCEFIINGESLKVGGLYSFDNGNGEINFIWSDNELTLDVSGSSYLTIEDLYFEVGDLKVTSGLLGIGISGEFNVYWNTATSEVTISGAPGVSLAIGDLNIKYSTILNIEVVGSLEIQADGYITFAPGVFEAGFTGSLNLGTECEFIINGNSITVGGLFTLSSGDGEIGFLWSNNEFTLYVSGGPSVDVTNLYFETGNLIVDCDEVGLGINGQFNLDWNAANNELTISSVASVSLEITNVDFTYGTTLDVSITGSLNIQANGYINLAPGFFEAGFSGSLNLGASCEFEVNGNSITVGGLFTLSGSGGVINFYWNDNSFTLDVSGGQSLTVSNFYFKAGLLIVSGEDIEVGISGEFNLDWNTATSVVTISGDSGISLSIQNVNITYSSTLNVKIIGCFNIQAGGYISFGPGLFTAGFSGTLNLGTSCQFIINSNSVSIGGVFSLSSGSGAISFLWQSNQFVLEVSGSPQLTVTNLYFEAEISNKNLLINADEIKIGVGGDMTLNWDSYTDEIEISSEAGVFLLITNIDISYASDIDISINGTLSIQADGYIALSNGNFEASFSGSLTLSPGFGFEINGDNILLSGEFELVGGDGVITITWTDNNFSCDVSGGVSLTINDLYFEIDVMKINADFVNVNLDGDFEFYLNKNIKQFEISSSVTFGFDNLHIYTKEGSTWYTICSVQIFDITGGGYMHLESGTNAKIKIDFNYELNLNNLVITPPSSWYCDLSIGSATLWGDAYINLEKTTSGEGKFAIIESSGTISGHISSFDASVRLGSTDLDVSYSFFNFVGSFSVIMDNTNNDFQVSAEGSLDLYDFDANYGDVDILIDLNLDGNGNIIIQYQQNNLDISADVDYTWDILLDSTLIGDWEAHGNLEGDVDVSAVWQTGAGNVEIIINDPGIFNSLEIIHDSLTFSLADISLNPGSVTFEWQRNDQTGIGYILIDSSFTQNICTLNLIEISWGTKSASIGWPEFASGDIKFAWNIPNRYVTLNNGISNLGPTLTYEDTSQSLEVSGSIGSLQSDYSKTITIKWYELSGEISGILIDTSNSHLAELLQFKVIKGTTGKKLVIYGLQCDDFYIMKDSSNNLKFGGQIYIANHIVYSKYISGNWQDVDVQWDFQSTPKLIKFTKDPAYDFTLKLISVNILGYQFIATVDFINADYCEIKWSIGTSGTVYIDTNWNYLSTITFEMWHNSGIGLEITVSALRAENWWVSWTAWPPQEWNVQSGGSLQIGSIDINVYYNNQWNHLWPW